MSVRTICFSLTALVGASFIWALANDCGDPATSAGDDQSPHTLRHAAPQATGVRVATTPVERRVVRLCQALSPAAPHCVTGVDCAASQGCGELTWDAMGPVPWQAFAQGEYVGHHRTAHVPEYRLRVDDLLEFRYRLTRVETRESYRLNVGDEVRVESFTDAKLNRNVIIQQDGKITLPLVGEVQASGRTATQLRGQVEKKYKKFIRIPAITITPVRINARLEDLRAVVDSRAGEGGQAITARVTPEGTIALPGIGTSVAAQGLTLGELKREINERYVRVAKIRGVEVTPRLEARAPRFVYVLGEVPRPGRYELSGPTTAIQAIAMAGSWNVGANLRHVVVFRRGDDWRLLATRLDLKGALHGKRPCPADEIWLSDSDIVVVPKLPILIADEWIDLFFTRGLYGVIPFQGPSLNFQKLSTI